jgi:hypothetical protein
VAPSTVITPESELGKSKAILEWLDEHGVAKGDCYKIEHVDGSGIATVYCFKRNEHGAKYVIGADLGLLKGDPRLPPNAGDVAVEEPRAINMKRPLPVAP